MAEDFGISFSLLFF